MPKRKYYKIIYKMICNHDVIRASDHKPIIDVGDGFYCFNCNRYRLIRQITIRRPATPNMILEHSYYRIEPVEEMKIPL